MDISANDIRELAYDYLREGHFEDALAAFSECLQLEPEAKLYFSRGTVYFQLKNWKQAIADFTKAQELGVRDPENEMALAISLAMDNKIYEAIDCYESLLIKMPQLVRAHIQL